MAERTNLTPAQKLAIVREHLIEKVPVSTLCEKHRISPVNFYNWQRALFENGESCFERKKNTSNAKRQDDASARRIAELEAKIQSKNEVIAELLQEHVELKKEIGGP